MEWPRAGTEKDTPHHCPENPPKSIPIRMRNGKGLKVRPRSHYFTSTDQDVDPVSSAALASLHEPLVLSHRTGSAKSRLEPRQQSHTEAHLSSRPHRLRPPLRSRS